MILDVKIRGMLFNGAGPLKYNGIVNIKLIVKTLIEG